MANNFELQGREELPMFQFRGCVKETGLAVVLREGECMIPAPASEAINRAGAKPEQTL